MACDYYYYYYLAVITTSGPCCGRVLRNQIFAIYISGPSLPPSLSTVLAPYTPNVVKDFQQVKHVH